MEKFGIILTSDEIRVIFQKYGCIVGGGNRIKFRHFIKLVDPTQPNRHPNTTANSKHDINIIIKEINELLMIKYGTIINGCQELNNECIYNDLHLTGYITSKDIYKVFKSLKIDIDRDKLMIFINYFNESQTDQIDYQQVIGTLRNGYLTTNNNNKRLNQLTMMNDTSSTNTTAIRTLSYTSPNRGKFNNLHINTHILDDDHLNSNTMAIKTVHGIYDPESVIEKIDRYASPSVSQKRPFIQKTSHFSSQEITRIFQKLKRGCLDMYGTKVNIEKKIKSIFYELINVNIDITTSNNISDINKDQFLQLLVLLGFNREILNSYDISVITEWLEHHKDGNIGLNGILQVFGLV